MKVHYINILLFAIPLNILVTLCHVINTHKKPYITPRHIQTTRLLCECELYAPANYDDDLQMKKVMENFNRQTSERFHEYDERMKTTRQKCKEQCDKEIQKIILKDKIEKELTEKFGALQTDIQNDAIPTCVCEKSIADKVEKGCLRCGSVLGGGIAPSVGLLGGIGQVALSAWKTAAIIAAKEAAEKLGIAAGKIAGEARGMEVVTHVLKLFGVDKLFPGIFNNFVKTRPYNEITTIANSILGKYRAICTGLNNSNPHAACSQFQLNLGIHKQIGNTISRYGTPDTIAIPNKLDLLLEKATKTAEAKAAQVSSETSSKILTKQTDVINTIYMSNQTAIIASIIAILIIVLIMVIIYLILRYRRKKKMKKKLQYIKLFEE